jgi:hypothetical protein
MSGEVERIVAWLRAMDAERPGDNFCGWIAGMIERGDHLPEPEGGSSE